MLSIHDVTGVVTQILSGQKYVVAFTAFGRSQTGILIGQKLRIVGSYDTPDTDDFEHVVVGSKVRFSCHEFESKADHEHDWYVTSAWLMNHMNLKDICLGLYNCSGKVQYLTNRLGVLNFTDHNGSTHTVLFLASKFSLRGKRLNAKQNLPSLLAEDNLVLFDAIPCIPDENDFQCSWFATNVWFQGPRPVETKFETLPDEERCSSSILREYKMMATSPRSLFLKRKGQILKIVNSEFGVALMCIQNNRWDTVLFHRSFTYIYKLALSNQNLQEVLCEGDVVDIIAVPATKNIMTQWVATQVAIIEC